MKNFITRMYVKATGAIQDVKNSDRGDTNFVSMLLIIGIVVVFAGLFLTLGKDLMNSISKKVTDFLEGLK